MSYNNKKCKYLIQGFPEKKENRFAKISYFSLEDFLFFVAKFALKCEIGNE